jgi:Ca2+-binding RTX toxin-like protein
LTSINQSINSIDGGDTYRGGAGFDIVGFGVDLANFTVDLSITTGQAITRGVFGGLGSVFDSVEGLFGGGGNDQFAGDAVANRLIGGGGNDSLNGRAGDDTLDGGAGNDSFFGGEGRDTFVVAFPGGFGGGSDLIEDYNALEDSIDFGGYTPIWEFNRNFDNDNQLDDAVALYGPIQNGAPIWAVKVLNYSGIVTSQGVTLAGGAGNDALQGTEFADQLSGLGGDDSLDGGAGNDTLLGGEGNDVMGDQGGNDRYDSITAGGGNDSVLGGGGNDTVFGGGGEDLLQGDVGNDSLNGGADNDRIEAFGGNDVVNGDDGDDILLGGLGNDTITGGIGVDVITGGFGRDSMSGGAGGDRFVFTATTDSGRFTFLRNIITDFSSAAGDKIDLSAIDGNSGTVGFQKIQASQLTFTPVAGGFKVNVDVLGLPTFLDMSIEVRTAGPLTAADFIL